MPIVSLDSQYDDLLKKLKHITLPPNMTLSLQNPCHIISLDNSTFSLDFNTPHWHKMLNTPHPLLKAIGKPSSVLDACAGFGKDGWILANQGHTVTSCEQNEIIFTLLDQAIQHAPNQLQWRAENCDCTTLFSTAYDVIYLDPMFEKKSKAKPKQNMQIIQLLVDTQPFTAWEAAYKAAKKRLVIKHDNRTQPIECLPKPSFQVHNERKSRFDVYLKP